MKLTILGKYGPYGKAGGGCCSGYLVQSGKTNLCLDMGSGVLSKLLAQMDLDKVDGLFLSHLHFDHTSDLLPLRYRLEELGHKLTIYTGYEDSEWYKILFDHPLFNMVSIDETSKIELGDLTLTFKPVDHPVPCHSIKITEKGGGTLCYSGDTSYCDSIKQLANECDVFLLDCSKPDSENSAHMKLSQAKELSALHSNLKIIATHQSALFDPETVLPKNGNIVSARENETYTI